MRIPRGWDRMRSIMWTTMSTGTCTLHSMTVPQNELWQSVSPYSFPIAPPIIHSGLPEVRLRRNAATRRPLSLRSHLAHCMHSIATGMPDGRVAKLIPWCLALRSSPVRACQLCRIGRCAFGCQDSPGGGDPACGQEWLQCGSPNVPS